MPVKEEYSSKVYNFKTHWCDENGIIREILKEKCSAYFLETILDVGAGMGDLASNVFSDKKALCIDLVLPTESYIFDNLKHTWIEGDFFNFSPQGKIGTLFISHTQQFLDENITKLQTKISEIDPQYIILISNSNDGLMGDIVTYTLNNFTESNPEVYINLRPAGYDLLENFPFTATLSCKSFEILAEQVAYLMVNNSEEYRNKITSFLREKIDSPIFLINETIEIYERSNR